MSVRSASQRRFEVEMTAASDSRPRRRQRRDTGQIIVIAVIAMMSLIGGVALVLEAGNAYGHQRQAQNGIDAVANAGATVLAQHLGGDIKTDADVDSAVAAFASTNALTSTTAWYTDVDGTWITPAGATAHSPDQAAIVGGGAIPPNAQGVHAAGSQAFGTTGFARVLGFAQFTASADATAIAGALAGGMLLPVVLPVNVVDCDVSGDLGIGEDDWVISNPDPNGGHPIGPEYIVPLCKTGGGSFMILDLDRSLGGPMNNCDEEVADPPAVQFGDFPTVVWSDNGNNCASDMVDEVNKLAGQVVFIPICDGECVTIDEGSHAQYRIIKVTAFYLDYMSDVNNGVNDKCVGDGVNLIPMVGNGSSSCLAGWFVRYITRGPVGRGPISGAGAVGIQLVK
jgi:Flp pilus assembly protein TadG